MSILINLIIYPNVPMKMRAVSSWCALYLVDEDGGGYEDGCLGMVWVATENCCCRFAKGTFLRFVCFQEIRAHLDLLEDEIPVHPLAPHTDPRAPPAYHRTPPAD